MNGIIHKDIISKDELASDNYFLSLLKAAQAHGMISEEEVQKKQEETLALLGKMTVSFTHGMSTSIRNEKAQEILDSILYTVGTALKSALSPDRALKQLTETDIYDIFRLGLSKTRAKTKAAALIFSQCRKAMQPISNAAYIMAHDKRLSLVFTKYDPEYAARDRIISADYPVCLCDDRNDGMEFILNYFSSLLCEDRVLSVYSPRQIHGLLSGFDRNYGELVFNIYEKVIFASLGSVAAGNSPKSIALSKETADFACGFYRSCNLQREITRGTEKISGYLPDKNSRNYLAKSVPRLIAKLESARRINYLEELFFAAGNN